MFITHQPRQTRENAPTSPCNHGKENTRATSADAPQANVGGSRAIAEGTHPSQGTVGGSALTPTGRGAARKSRHTFSTKNNHKGGSSWANHTETTRQT